MGPPIAAVHRWEPPLLGTSRSKQALKRALMSGVVVELGHAERRVDEAWSSSGAATHLDSFEVSSGGSIRVSLNAGDGIFRAGKGRTPASPERAAAALSRLPAWDLVPSPARSGETAGVAWLVEQALPGHRPTHLTADVIAQVTEFCRSLPRSDEAPRSVDEDIETIARHVPEYATKLVDLKTRSSPLPTSGSIARHGDLWAGNLLVDDGRLSGVLDWDAWNEFGVPGADLLNLISYEAAPSGSALGQRWAARPWDREPFTSAAAAYWPGIGLKPTPEFLEAVGVAWWACQAAATLERLPHLASDRRWLEANLDPVLHG